jgi:PASTA domain
VYRAILVAALLAVGAAAGWWYFSDPGETEEPEAAPSVVSFGEPGVGESPPAQVRTISGIQTTVPETVGQNERTAVFTLETGGFRVRVMTRKVADSGAEGVVVQQLPRGGVTRRVGWIVTIVVGRLR